MDFGTVLTRAIKVTWEHKILWVLGFLVTLGGGLGGVRSGPQFNYSLPGGEASWMQDIARSPEIIGLIIAAISVLICILLIISIVLWIINIIARGGLIAGVQQIETEGRTTFRSAWSVGVKRFWRILGLELLISIPIFVVVIAVLVLFGLTFASVVVSIEGASGNNGKTVVPWVLMVIMILCCLMCMIAVISIIVSALRVFGERAIVLENLGVLNSISRGWQVLRTNLGNIILIALVMMVIELVFGLISGVAAGVVLLPTLLPVISEALSYGTVSGGTAVVAAIGMVVAMIIGAIINTLFITFNSTTWTLAYRQFMNAPSMPAIQPPAPGV